MKKIKYLLFLLIMLFVTTVSVDAATVTKSTYDGKIKVEGTGEGQIQIVLFNSKNQVMYMTTTDTTSNKFSVTLPEIKGLSSGNYKVKVADYDGTNTDTKTLTIDIKNPKTGDNITNYIVYSMVSSLLLISIGIYIKKNKFN